MRREAQLQHTEGRELFWLAGGRGCKDDGDAARGDFDCALEAWYMGSEGVAALDMLAAWPEGQRESGLSGRRRDQDTVSRFGCCMRVVWATQRTA